MLSRAPQYTRPGTPSGSRPRSLRHELEEDGRTLGGFHLAQEIACGGMGRVYLAHRLQHAVVGQAAAVKLIHSHLAREKEFVEMFLDEARIVSSVSHPNVCRVLDFGREDGMYYLAMDHVLGESLADVIARLQGADSKQIAVPLIRNAAYQVCEALHAVHEAHDAEGNPLRIVHRDISPQNIMLGYDGCIRLLDFGVARAADRLHVTRAGIVKGRLSYMAPEQLRGANIDRRADLWSVGVVLWEGLAGRRLFQRENEFQTLEAVTLEDIPPAKHSARVVPISLLRTAAKALQRDPDRRHRTARELGFDLMRSEADLPHITTAEVSQWMHSAFAKSLAYKRLLLREAAHAARYAQSPTHSSIEAIEDDHAMRGRAVSASRPVIAGTDPGRSSVSDRGPSLTSSDPTPVEELWTDPSSRPRRVGALVRWGRSALLMASITLLVGAPFHSSFWTFAERMRRIAGTLAHLAVTNVTIEPVVSADDSTVPPDERRSSGDGSMSSATSAASAEVVAEEVAPEEPSAAPPILQPLPARAPVQPVPSPDRTKEQARRSTATHPTNAGHTAQMRRPRMIKHPVRAGIAKRQKPPPKAHGQARPGRRRQIPDNPY